GLVLAFARILYVNGQTTDETVAAAEALAPALGLPAKITARWGELQLQSDELDAVVISGADPEGVDMDRVVRAMRAIEALRTGGLEPAAALQAGERIARAPPAPAWLFALAAGTGATALAVLFGVQHLTAAVLIFVSAAAGAILRRAVGRRSANPFLQP